MVLIALASNYSHSSSVILFGFLPCNALRTTCCTKTSLIVLYQILKLFFSSEGLILYFIPSIIFKVIFLQSSHHGSDTTYCASRSVNVSILKNGTKIKQTTHKVHEVLTSFDQSCLPPWIRENIPLYDREYYRGQKLDIITRSLCISTLNHDSFTLLDVPHSSSHIHPSEPSCSTECLSLFFASLSRLSFSLSSFPLS